MSIISNVKHPIVKEQNEDVCRLFAGVRSIRKNGEKIMYDLESRVNGAVFPGLQGGPHNHQVAGIATALKQAKTPEFKAYQTQVIKNAKQLCRRLESHGFKIATGGTDVHLVLVDLRSRKLSGAKAEYILEEISIACNKNTGKSLVKKVEHNVKFARCSTDFQSVLKRKEFLI